MIYSDNAIRFYLDLDEQQKWAIREFLRCDARNNEIADDLLSIDDYVNNKRDKLLKIMEIRSTNMLNPEYERFVKNLRVAPPSGSIILAKRQP